LYCVAVVRTDVSENISLPSSGFFSDSAVITVELLLINHSIEEYYLEVEDHYLLACFPKHRLNLKSHVTKSQMICRCHRREHFPGDKCLSIPPTEYPSVGTLTTVIPQNDYGISSP
jgi:hypothetical protein